ncbi:cysteine peptidase family C39 domain-containing protein [Pedobacter duraquae]|nr:cysteine peptidase family C39 domain-containing protein [Pedobacter duraquae]
MFKFLETSQPNVIAVTKILLKALRVDVSPATIAISLQDHPEYPSLLAISDCLTEWSLPNQSYNITKDDYDPADLEYPFIAHSRVDGGYFMVVHNIADKQVTYSDEQSQKAIFSETEFLKKWSGIALHATPNQKSGEENYQRKITSSFINKLMAPALFTVFLATIILSFDYPTLKLGYISLLTFKLLGLGVSILLLIHSIDTNNPLVQNLCSLGNKNNCNAILKSDAAKLLSWLSWSEIGFFYFAGSALVLLALPGSLPILAWLNVCAMPYTVYSIGYQYTNKNWCVLCCTIQAILGMELLTNLTINPGIYSLNSAVPDIKTALTLTTCFSIPILTWFFIKPFLLRMAQYIPLKQQLKKFKYNSDLFNQVLTSQPCYAVPDELMPIVLGNPDATTIITMVSNPFCGPCAKAHQTIDEWLKVRTDIKLKIIFTTADHDDDLQTKVARHVSALSFLNDASLLEKALNDWYKQGSKKFEQWAAAYPIDYSEEMSLITKKQKAWCNLTEIIYTPTILVNGYKLPEPYRLEDIKYLLT